MTENGCQQCGENTFSGARASSCISCPGDMVSVAGSSSKTDCNFGENIVLFFICSLSSFQSPDLKPHFLPFFLTIFVGITKSSNDLLSIESLLSMSYTKIFTGLASTLVRKRLFSYFRYLKLYST